MLAGHPESALLAVGKGPLCSRAYAKRLTASSFPPSVSAPAWLLDWRRLLRSMRCSPCYQTTPGVPPISKRLTPKTRGWP